MKKIVLTLSMAAFAAGSAFADDLATSLAKATDCSQVKTVVATALTGAGGKEAAAAKVKTIVGSAITSNPDCACEIVTAAINATEAKDSKTMITAIVESAIQAEPIKSQLIAECAVAAAPNQSAVVDAIMEANFGVGSSVAIQSTGKQAVVPYGKGGVGPDSGGRPKSRSPWGGGGFGQTVWAPVYLVSPIGGASLAGGGTGDGPDSPADPVPAE